MAAEAALCPMALTLYGAARSRAAVTRESLLRYAVLAAGGWLHAAAVAWPLHSLWTYGQNIWYPSINVINHDTPESLDPPLQKVLKLICGEQNENN
jgi:hypothetical protein